MNEIFDWEFFSKIKYEELPNHQFEEVQLEPRIRNSRISIATKYRTEQPDQVFVASRANRIATRNKKKIHS